MRSNQIYARLGNLGIFVMKYTTKFCDVRLRRATSAKATFMRCENNLLTAKTFTVSIFYYLSVLLPMSSYWCAGNLSFSHEDRFYLFTLLLIPHLSSQDLRFIDSSRLLVMKSQQINIAIQRYIMEYGIM